MIAVCHRRYLNILRWGPTVQKRTTLRLRPIVPSHIFFTKIPSPSYLVCVTDLVCPFTLLWDFHPEITDTPWPSNWPSTEARNPMKPEDHSWCCSLGACLVFASPSLTDLPWGMILTFRQATQKRPPSGPKCLGIEDSFSMTDIQWQSLSPHKG